MEEFQQKLSNIDETLKQLQGLLSDQIKTLHEQLNQQYLLLLEKQKELEQTEAKMKENCEKQKTKIVLDIGGKRFATSKATLISCKGSYFDAMLSSGNWQPDVDGSYFIDRNPKHFNIILDYMRTGKINIKYLNEESLEKIKGDLDYYQINIPSLQSLSLHHPPSPPPPPPTPSQPSQTTIQSTSHPHYNDYVVTNLLKNDDSFWASPTNNVMSSKSMFIVFDFIRTSKVSTFSIKTRSSDNMAPKTIVLEFADATDGPWRNACRLTTDLNISSNLQSFPVSEGIGRYCKVQFVDNHGCSDKNSCKFVVNFIGFT